MAWWIKIHDSQATKAVVIADVLARTNKTTERWTRLSLISSHNSSRTARITRNRFGVESS